MAESFLFCIAESLVAKLASRAYEEASQVFGVYEDLQSFKPTLSLIKGVLLDAEKKQESSQELREWLKQIKHVFSDAENMLDEVEYEALRKQLVKASGSTKAKVGRFISSSNPLVFRYKLAQNVKEIKERLDRVAADRLKFGLHQIDVDRRVVHRREMTYSHVVESDVIGREHDKEKIVQLLMQHNASVIPIVGIGGLGKTTLAKFVFNDERIAESFPLKMWVCVSDEFDVRQLIIKIINCADEFASVDARVGPQNLKELDIEQLANHLRNKLVGQKFLLVLDDVWNQDRVKWVELRDLIQVGAQGSKILVTTRSHTIASMMGTTSSHHLEGLSLEDSLSLFVKWAFKEGEEEKYPDLVMIGREIVHKCGGVPLAVRTLGSLLFSKHEIGEWESLRHNEIWKLPQKKDDILPALKLSYDQMPSYLRRCFAMFSLFPKDHLFDSLRMAHLWGALGLLPLPSKNKTLEEVAIQYLYELMSTSFIQDTFDLGTIYFFTIHDLVHDLALHVARDEKVQHLSFAENIMLGKSCIPKSTCVKTILFPVEGIGADNEALLNAWVSMYKYLRFLDLSDSTCETLPKFIGKLKHLRFLSLSCNKNIKRLPESVCMLHNLQVLSLDGCTSLETLPEELSNLVNLQRLEITTKQSVLPESDIAKLSSLRHLCIRYCERLESIFARIKLPTLRTLNVQDCGNLKSLPLSHFPQLETLEVENCGNVELSAEGHENENYKLRLKYLSLDSFPSMVTLPGWLRGSASTLQCLIIFNCYNLEMLPEWLPTTSSLKTFWLRNCPKLMSLPDDIDRLAALNYLKIRGCPELCRKYQPHVGECWPKISHIKIILIDEHYDLEEQLTEDEDDFEEEESLDNQDKC